jgi:hypothetical protein
VRSGITFPEHDCICSFSVSVSILKAVEMIHLQEQLRHRGAGHKRTQDKPVLPGGSRLAADFTDEVSYIARQSQEIWEPVFGYYYTSAWLLAERLGGGRTEPPPFFNWLERQFPEIYRALTMDAQAPPVVPSYVSFQAGGFAPVLPGPGEGLTRAYYELLALHAVRPH